MDRFAWTWIEAKKLAERTEKKKAEVILETGYGPSGLPHIGTFQEVARTTMVKKAYEALTGKKARLISFSDDLDALRKVPSNVPNQEELAKYIGVSLTSVPNPYGSEYKSYAEHNNAKLQEFLDNMGFEYEFFSATECYKNGKFNEILKAIGRKVQEVKEIATYGYGIKGGNRKETYCPFIPIDQETGKQYFELEPDWYVEDDHLFYKPLGETEIKKVSLENGNVKCQWKVDWAVRWMALGVDYEMHGKDLMESAEKGQKLCKLLELPAPLNYKYEMFLDEQGAKISKSRGNGLEVDQWLRYAPKESLLWYIFQNPSKAHRLFIGVIPQAIDSLVKELDAEPDDNNASWFIFGEKRPKAPAVTYQMLLNLVNIANADNPDQIWKYIENYQPGIDRKKEDLLVKMVEGVINYYNDRIAPNKVYREPSDQDKKVLNDLADAIEKAEKEKPANIAGKDYGEYLMTFIYDVGKNHFGNDRDKLRDDYFKMLYQVLMGQDSGPRFGHFAVAFGVRDTVKLLRGKV